MSFFGVKNEFCTKSLFKCVKKKKQKQLEYTAYAKVNVSATLYILPAIFERLALYRIPGHFTE